MLEKYISMVKTCFKGSALFDRARQSAFEVFLNKDRMTSGSDKMQMSEALGIYTDIILRKGGMKTITEKVNEEEYLKLIV